MPNYVNLLPRDRGGEPLQEFSAPVRAITSVIQDDNAVASSAISLHPNASSLEISAFGGQGVAIRWVGTGETASVSPRASVIASGAGANFDHHIPSGIVRRFAVPRESAGQMAGGQIGSVNGLYQRVARINAGITSSSMLLVQY